MYNKLLSLHCLQSKHSLLHACGSMVIFYVCGSMAIFYVCGSMVIFYVCVTVITC